MKTCFLVDGTAFVYKGYYAFIKNPLMNSRGENVSAVFGFISSMQKILKTYKPDYFSIIFDAPGKNFRHELYDSYKANRPPMPVDLSSQIPKIKEFMKISGFSSYSISGVEADDVLGSMANIIATDKMEAVIVSGDKDFIQLMSDKIKILNPKSLSSAKPDEYFDEQFIRKKYDIHPSQMKDYLAMVGDSSDNVPGVDGIGAKTAAKLLNMYPSINEIYENIDQIKMNSPRNKLKAGRDNAFLSFELVDIKIDLSIDYNLDEMRPLNLCYQQIDKWLVENEFPSLRNSYSSLAKLYQKDYQEKNSDYQEASESDTAATVVEAPVEMVSIKKILLADIDGFLSSYNPGDLISISYCSDSLFHLVHNNIIYSFSGSVFLSLFEKIFQKDNNIRFYMFNLKEFYKYLFANKADDYGVFYDIGLMAFLADSSSRNPDPIKINDFLFKKGISIKRESFPDQSSFSAFIAYQSKPFLCDALDEYEVSSLYLDVDMPLVKVLAFMEYQGVFIDEDYLGKVNQGFVQEALSLNNEIQDKCGEKFNLNSPKQLGEILFEKLKIQETSKKKLKKTKTGYSTSSETLLKYSDHPLIAKILRYRSLTKLITTYTDVLPKMINQDTGMVHTSYNQMVTVTGRLSSEKPNLQNIPVRQPEGALIREAFRAEKESVILSADYSQIELRIMAHLSCDEVMLNAFHDDADIHTETASKIFSIPAEKVTEEDRSRAKAVNFGVIYGMGPRKLSQDTGIDIDSAKKFIENYFNVHKGVKEYIDRTIQQVRQDGFIRNIFGRIRYLPDINSTRNDKRVFAEHMAINSPIQGSAADLLKKAMIVIDDILQKKKLKSRLIMQIHDELVFNVLNEEVGIMEKIIKTNMENIVLLNVPLRVSIGKGNNWREAH